MDIIEPVHIKLRSWPLVTKFSISFTASADWISPISSSRQPLPKTRPRTAML